MVGITRMAWVLPVGRKLETPGWFEILGVDRVRADARERRPYLARRIGERPPPLRFSRCPRVGARHAAHENMLFGSRAIGSAEAVVHRPLVLARVVIGFEGDVVARQAGSWSCS